MNYLQGKEQFWFVNGVKIYQYKVENSKINTYQLCLGNNSKYFTVEKNWTILIRV